MAIKIVDNFSLSKQAPLDERIVATTVDEALANIDKLSRYEGLTVYIISKETYYRFTGGIEDENFISLDKPSKRSTYVHTQATPAKTWSPFRITDTTKTVFSFVYSNLVSVIQFTHNREICSRSFSDVQTCFHLNGINLVCRFSGNFTCCVYKKIRLSPIFET